MPRRYFIKTFGCQMNEYDSARMADVLEAGMGLEATSEPAEADVLLMNTCSVREKAQEKVFSLLGEWRALKARRPQVLIGVGGCVASQEGEAITARAPFVDLVFGPQTLHRLTWRGRLYETLDHNPALAAASYRTIVRAYQHFFYAQLARQRLAALGNTQAASEPQLDRIQPSPEPHLVDSFPEDSPHLAKARLLANAGLTEYIALEIKADPEFSTMSSLAEAQIYSSYGETFRAVRAAKRALPSAASASIQSIPLAYWRILFPEPWWNMIQAESAKNNLDPYLVASLIRQESEFDPTAISHANAYGLMQLLPSVGRTLAREEGIKHFQTFQLLDPNMNINLGTRYLRQMLDRFGGVEEYALAAYNAGDYRVAEWQAAGPYSGIDEFVESIPFTETREYVEAIRRNQETYRAIDDFARAHGAATASASH